MRKIVGWLTIALGVALLSWVGYMHFIAPQEVAERDTQRIYIYFLAGGVCFILAGVIWVRGKAAR